MFWQLIPIVVPVFLCVGIGFCWSRLDVPFDREFITRIVMNVGAPCLILDGIGRLAFESAVVAVAPAVTKLSAADYLR